MKCNTVLATVWHHRTQAADGHIAIKLKHKHLHIRKENTQN